MNCIRFERAGGSVTTYDLADNDKVTIESANMSLIEWHRYPEEKPKSNGFGNRTCLVAYNTKTLRAVATSDFYFSPFGDNDDMLNMFEPEMDKDCKRNPDAAVTITHWAYLPQAPKGVTNERKD